MSQQILHASRYSVYNDLIAFEGKYHRTCYEAFMRRTSKTSDTDSINMCDLAMQWLIEELKNSAEQGHIL